MAFDIHQRQILLQTSHRDCNFDSINAVRNWIQNPNFGHTAETGDYQLYHPVNKTATRRGVLHSKACDRGCSGLRRNQFERLASRLGDHLVNLAFPLRGRRRGCYGLRRNPVSGGWLPGIG